MRTRHSTQGEYEYLTPLCLVCCSAFKAGNCLPPGTTSVEKRTVASKVPHWDPSQCTECNSCSFICPHAAIRPVVATAAELAEGSVPQGFEVKTLKGAKAASAGQEYLYRVQVGDAELQ